MGTDVTSISRSPLTSVCCPLGVQLPQTMRAKIVNREFVDFGQLLEKTEHLGQDDKQYSLAVGQGGTLVFRLRQQWQPQGSWATIDGELWNLFVVTSVARPFQIEQGQSGGTQPQQELRVKGVDFMANSHFPWGKCKVVVSGSQAGETKW